MSDFSDDEDEPHGESRPGPRTGSDRDGSVVEASNPCDQPINEMLTICVHEHNIVYSGTDDRNSDIANMSDFSDDEDEVQEESQPEPRTGSDRDRSVEETLNLCDRPINNMVTICVNERSMVYSGTDDRNSDIADMSYFSDNEDETQEKFQPGPRTENDRHGSIEEVSRVCDRPITKTVTAEDGRDSLDPNDPHGRGAEYWTKFRCLTRQAFCWMMIAFRIVTIQMRSKM